MMLNYRDIANQPFSTIPLGDVLRGRLTPEQIRDRIILLGVTHTKNRDMALTPYGTEIPGVFVQAQIVSQIVSAGLNERPLLQTLPEWIEITWMGGWAMVGGLMVWLFQLPQSQRLGLTSAAFVIYTICIIAFSKGYWIPLIPTFLAIGLSGCLVYYARKL
jgi:CHASE2 domain-containing sensor protein